MVGLRGRPAHTLVVSIVASCWRRYWSTGWCRPTLHNWLVNRLAAFYIEIIRNTPLLVQLVFIYFGVFFQLRPLPRPSSCPAISMPTSAASLFRAPHLADVFAWLVFVAIGVIAAIIVYKLAARTSSSALVSALLALALCPDSALGWIMLGTPLTLELPSAAIQL